MNIEDAYLDSLAQEYIEPPEEPSMDGVQLAMGSRGAKPGQGPKTMTDFGNALVDDAKVVGGAMLDMGAATVKGTTQGFVGLPGDLESIGRIIVNLMGGNVDDKTALPTTEEIKTWLDKNVGKVGDGKNPYESIGEVVAPGGYVDAAKGVVKGAKATGKALAPTAANMIEQQLERAGMIMRVVPEGPAQVVIPVKVGDREIKIPAAQAATLQRAIKNLTPAEQAKFRSDTARTFVDILSTLPSKQEFAAAAIGGQAKKGWYEGSTKAIMHVFGPDAPRFAALLSATSPQTSVESNLFNALQVWKNWTAAGRPTDRASIIKVMGDSVQGNKGEGSVLDAWINNSVRALSAEDPGKVILSGPKVDSFMRNLQGNVDEVTNDAWMASFTLVDQQIFGGSLTKTDAGKGPGYLAMNARVRETAKYLTKLTGETWTPAEVQETIWSWAKTLYETAGAKGESRTAVQLIQDNAITDELIASTPDFRTLFYDPQYANILERAGYGDQLSQLRAATGSTDAAAGAKKPGTSSKATAVDPKTQGKLLERNAKRLDTLRVQREKEAAAKAKVKVQNPSGRIE